MKLIPFIIGVGLVIITLLIIGLILRKRIYDNVDRQEIWKMDIINRNTAAELARVKGLNLSGETQDKFESWKDQWEKIITKELPEIEEWLFEAEDAADRYRFGTAKKVVHRIDEALAIIEAEIAQMLEELDELLLSEESSRKEIENLKPIVVELRQSLSQNDERFGKGKEYFSAELTLIEEHFLTYYGLVESGDYIEARNLVDQLTLKLEVLDDQIGEYPEILDMCINNLPSQLNDLAIGLNEMKNDDYYIEHLGYEKTIENYRVRLKDSVKSLEKGSTSDVENIVSEMADEIKDMYEKLEQEVIAKNYIESQISNYQEAFEKLGEDFTETKVEVDILRKSYYFDDRDMERYLQMDKLITSTNKQLTDLSQAMEENKTSYSELRRKVELGFDQVEELQEKHEAFKKKVRNLRKEELDAREKLSGINRQFNDLNRQLNKSNLPGIPGFIWNTLEDISKKNIRVIQTLEKQPLDMSKVKQALSEAEATVKNAVEQIDTTLDQAFLTEQVIQYANRYRSRNPFLAAKLSEAERLFRSFEYELSLEHAAKAIEEVEPGSLKRIEANQEAI